MVDTNMIAYVASNKIIIYNFNDHNQSQIDNQNGFAISAFACDYHRGLIVWGTIEEEPKLIFYKSFTIVNSIQIDSNYEYSHLEFSHFGEYLAVCSGYNLDSKVILNIIDTETIDVNN